MKSYPLILKLKSLVRTNLNKTILWKGFFKPYTVHHNVLWRISTLTVWYLTRQNLCKTTLFWKSQLYLWTGPCPKSALMISFVSKQCGWVTQLKSQEQQFFMKLFKMFDQRVMKNTRRFYIFISQYGSSFKYFYRFLHTISRLATKKGNYKIHFEPIIHMYRISWTAYRIFLEKLCTEQVLYK